MISLERRLVASVLKSKEAALSILKHVNTDLLSAYSVLLFEIADDYYKKDKDRTHVDIDHICDRLALSIESEAKRELYVGYAKECISIDISPINVAELLLETKRKESAAILAQALANSDPTDASVIAKIDAHRLLLETAPTGEDGDDREVLHAVTVEEINKLVLSKEGLYQLLTPQFTDAIDGGAYGGHHILVVARPETGKTALVLSMIASLCRQHLEGLYFGNEDPIRSIVERFQGCLSRIPRLERLRDAGACDAILRGRGYDLARFISLAPGSVEEIDSFCERYKPKWIVVDQLRNLRCRAENRTNQLEILATDLRTLAKRRNCLVISVTQAGDSATDKLVLEMGDIDGSNTGIPAQMDLIVGLGLNKEYEKLGHRMISLCKNKLSGKHIHFPVSLNQYLSLIQDL